MAAACHIVCICCLVVLCVFASCVHVCVLECVEARGQQRVSSSLLLTSSFEMCLSMSLELMDSACELLASTASASACSLLALGYRHVLFIGWLVVCRYVLFYYKRKEKGQDTIFVSCGSLRVSEENSCLAGAVVIAFVVCWLPYHVRRLMFCYISDEQWTT